MEDLEVLTGYSPGGALDCKEGISGLLKNLRKKGTFLNRASSSVYQYVLWCFTEFCV